MKQNRHFPKQDMIVLNSCETKLCARPLPEICRQGSSAVERVSLVPIWLICLLLKGKTKKKLTSNQSNNYI